MATYSFTRALLKRFFRVESRYVIYLIAKLEFVNHCELVYNSIHLDSWLVNITCRVFLEVRPSMYLALDLIASYLLDSVVSWGERDKWLPIYNVSEQGNFATSMSKHRRLACSAEIKIVRSQVENLRKRNVTTLIMCFIIFNLLVPAI